MLGTESIAIHSNDRRKPWTAVLFPNFITVFPINYHPNRRVIIRRLVAVDFELASNDNSSSCTERDCDTLGLNVDLGVGVLANKDYLIIPDGVSINTGLKIFASKYCGTSLKKLEVNGELKIFFHKRRMIFRPIINNQYYKHRLNNNNVSGDVPIHQFYREYIV